MVFCTMAQVILSTSQEYKSHECKEVAGMVDDISESVFPSPSQQSAIEILGDLEDSKVFELLLIVTLPAMPINCSLKALPRNELMPFPT